MVHKIADSPLTEVLRELMPAQSDVSNYSRWPQIQLVIGISNIKSSNMVLRCFISCDSVQCPR